MHSAFKWLGASFPPVFAGICCVGVGCGRVSSTELTSGDGGLVDGSAIDGVAPYVGVIGISQLPNGGNTVESLFSAVIAEATYPTFCPMIATSGCSFQECEYSGDGGVMESAGLITIIGGKLASPVELTTMPSDEGPSYDEVDQSTKSFAPGDIFSITASGGDVTAFHGSSAPAPADITLITPAPEPDAGQPGIFTIDEAHDLDVRWSGGSAGSQVQVQVATGSFARNVLCYFDAAAGVGTVPAALLSQLGSADGGVTTNFNVVPVSSQAIRATNANITVVVVGTPYSAAFETP